MKTKPVVPRLLAQQDVDATIGYYLSERAAQVALGFIDALEHAYAHIGRYPATGSARMPTNWSCPTCTAIRTSCSTSNVTITSTFGVYCTCRNGCARAAMCRIDGQLAS
jgi:plasmid stabilization system protein ParE